MINFPNQQNGHRAFTTKYHRHVNEIITHVELINDKGSLIRKVIALWDTGATNSVIRADLAQDLNLPIISYAEQSTANGKCSVPVYAVIIRLPNNMQFNVLVSGANISEDIDMLIGMDLIGLGDFNISNGANGTILSFVVPSFKETDYVAGIDDLNKRAFKNVGRNDRCPCGSGKKFKNCHGK